MPIAGSAWAARNAAIIQPASLVMSSVAGSERTAPQSKSIAVKMPPGRSASTWWRTTSTGSGRWNSTSRSTMASKGSASRKLRASPSA